MKDYNVLIDGQSFFDQPAESSMRTCDKIRKIVTDLGDDYTTVFLLNYAYFKNYYEMMTISCKIILYLIVMLLRMAKIWKNVPQNHCKHF